MCHVTINLAEIFVVCFQSELMADTYTVVKEELFTENGVNEKFPVKVCSAQIIYTLKFILLFYS